ncbi:pyridoxal-dependent decarboxylase [Escherichia coli]|uniref:pyridoxal-dependent decarboxylase n=1 Tax=Escherichia coli TaxID=562 RepID=UPI00288ADFB8|nr:pyridoxal-dependent decarboxylase [Escherichia coli]
MAPLGCGWVIWRDEEALPQELVFNGCDYLGGQIGTFCHQLLPPGRSGDAQYYEFLRLGREGYTKVQNALPGCRYLADRNGNWGRMSSSVPVARTKASRRFASN